MPGFVVVVVFCWRLIRFKRNIDTSNNCINKFDVLQLIFNKMIAF